MKQKYENMVNAAFELMEIQNDHEEKIKFFAHHIKMRVPILRVLINNPKNAQGKIHGEDLEMFNDMAKIINSTISNIFQKYDLTSKDKKNVYSIIKLLIFLLKNKNLNQFLPIILKKIDNIEMQQKKNQFLEISKIENELNCLGILATAEKIINFCNKNNIDINDTFSYIKIQELKNIIQIVYQYRGK